jgi:hypothetical protein
MMMMIIIIITMIEMMMMMMMMNGCMYAACLSPHAKSLIIRMLAQARKGRGVETVQEQQSEEEEEFDPEYMDVQEQEVVSSHRSLGRKSAPFAQQQGVKTDEREGPKCGLGLTLKERSDGEYYIKRMEKGGPCEASGEVWPVPSSLFRDFLVGRLSSLFRDFLVGRLCGRF